MTWLVSVIVAAASAIVAALRWLRVAQREHYIAGSASRFARRWWIGVAPNPLLLVVVLLLTAVSSTWTPAGWLAAVTAGFGPIGLSIKGRTSPLAWTSRMRKVAVVTGIVAIGLIGLGAWIGSGAAALASLLVPVWVDLALALLGPLERRSGDRWVDQASKGLARSGARVVAITGSYGKTSTKLIAAHLLSGLVSTTASPASFNNRMGLARAINEGLAPGTEVFVAEMGTYGPGEIRALCSWIPPEVAVMTAIGPVHLERMNSEETIAAAKREILERARVGVINVDHPLLASIADEEAVRIPIVRCSSRRADVEVFSDPERGVVVVRGVEVGAFDAGALHAGNVACAVGVVDALGLDVTSLGDRMQSVPVAPNRQVVTRSQAGFTIIDDTFNSNPAGARAALARLQAIDAGRRVLVTPGMVELGSVQDQENRAFVSSAADVVSDLVVVGRTNRASLVEGAAEAGLSSVIVKGTREEAVAWVRENLTQGDAVLYENDLPDHYP